jgi:hypothetical protein
MTLALPVLTFLALLALPLKAPAALPLTVDELPLKPERVLAPREADWLVHKPSDRAGVYRDSAAQRIVIDNGLVRRAFQLSPNAATVAMDNLMTGESILRAVEPEAVVTLNGQRFAIGGLRGQPDRGYLTENWIASLTNDPGAFQYTGFLERPTQAPFPWKRARHSADLPWPPPGRELVLSFAGTGPAAGVSASVHYELFDGAPVLGKWLTLSNGTDRVLSIDQFTVERLAAVEAEAAVDERPGTAWRTPAITVLSDYMFKGMDLVTGNQVARWVEDPEYTTQVSYLLKTPCTLVCEPPLGPGVQLAPGDVFRSFRVWLVIHDSTERERQGLTIRRAHRLLAPWSTENPIMMHVRSADSAAFRLAVDQCAEVGFEMIIYTFGSGLNVENEDPAHIARIKADVDYARQKGVEVGAYSLFSSRHIDDANDVINPQTLRPGGAIFGHAPCLASQWGTNYLRKLTNFLARTGLSLLEHDGPYPGDVCASTNHPGHHGLADSQWVQWRLSAQLYEWCRANGIYVNQPDYYFFSGGSKTGMGYRETNWSLPRAQQLIHARQHIFDGTWTKPQTAGWMFVPLTEYHGGGPAATLEPLREHLQDYEAHLANNFGAGVQACWRGPRLYDSEETKELVKQWVAWFKKRREILESDIIHVRRPDGRDIDYVVQVNPDPRARTRAFAMVHNPLPRAVERTVVLPLYYAGLSGRAKIREREASAREHALDGQCRARVPVRIPANGRTWLEVEAD